MKPNTIRDRALKVCADQEAARTMWRNVMSEFPCAEKHELDRRRLAMLKTISEGGSIEDGAAAARKVLR